MTRTLPAFGAVSDGIAGTVQARPRSRRVSACKRAIAIRLITIVVLASISSGATSPLTWALIAVATGAMGLAAATGIPAHRKPGGRGIAVLLLAGGLLCGFGLIQAGIAYLPLADAPLILPDREVWLRPGSLSPDATFLAVLRIASALMFLWLVLCVANDPARARTMALALFAGIAAQAIWALLLLGPLGAGHVSAYPGAATGTFVGRNALATQLGIGLVLGLALLPRGQRALLHWLGLAFIAAALLATQSRMGLAATGAGALVVLGHCRPGWPGWLTALIVAGLGLALFGQGVSERAVWVGSAGTLRGDLYAQVWQLILTRPLTGYGLDSFPLAFEIFHRPPLPGDVVWDRAHSTYLTLWAEAGLLAGSLPPCAGLLALTMLWHRRAAPLAVAATGALVLCGLHSLVDFSLEIPANLFLLLALVGLGLAAARPAKGHDDE